MKFRDSDGEWPVVAWLVFYENDTYCSCHNTLADLPESGVQAVAWFIYKDDTVRCYIEGGLTTDPSIYTMADRKLIGTMLPDEVYFPLEQEIFLACNARVKALRRIHG